MRNEVKKLHLGVEPEAAVSGGMLIQSEDSAFLLFNAIRPTADGMRVEAGTAVLTVHTPYLCKFGLPNDEALAGHPILGDKDLDFGVFEVLNSDWLAEAKRQNDVCFPDSGWFDGARHFAVPMHDSTFECLAREVSIEVLVEPYGEVLGKIAERVLARRPKLRAPG